jgi:hypothetical protein
MEKCSGGTTIDNLVALLPSQSGHVNPGLTYACNQRRSGSRGGKVDALRTNAVRLQILARTKFVCKFCVAQIGLPNHG